MIKSKFKRVTSLFLATLMCVTTFAGIGSTTAYAASGEKADVYMVDFPRDGDANYDGVWGHSNLTLKNGWHTGRSNFTNLKAIGSYSGNVAYCIEPGISLKVGQTMNKYDENYFNNLASNGVISGDEIRLFVGRILQYGYRGTISTSWRSQNEAAANSIAQAYATQLLIWETVIGERDANFNHVAASGCSNVKDVINAKHPLRNKIFSYYNSMVQSVQNHATIPSFCNKSSGSARDKELIDNPEFAITIGKATYTERVDGGTMMLEAISKCKTGETTAIGKFHGLELLVEKNFLGINYMVLRGKTEYKAELSTSPVGSMVKLENLFNGLHENIDFLEKKIEQYQNDLEASKTEYDKPFAYSKELEEKLSRQCELNAQLDLENAKAVDADLSGPEEEREADDRMEAAAIVAEDKGAYPSDREGRTR